VRYELIGHFRLVDGTTTAVVSARKQQALLATLLIRADQLVSTEQLIAELWGDRPPRRVQASLHVHVSQLRRLLGGPPDRVDTVPGGYVLRLAPGDEVDAREFRSWLEQGRACARARRHEEAVGCFERALALWRGAPLRELRDGRVVAAFAGWLEETRLECLELLVEARLTLGAHHELVDLLSSLVAEHPLHEAFHRQLMVALFRAGRRADALRAYQRARRVLHDELGLEPARPLRDLHRSILLAHQRSDVVRAG
jgi:DNA-binding SARP family transcriptional activator